MADVIGSQRARNGDAVHRWENITRIFGNLVKFALVSAVDGSRKIIPGRKRSYKIVPEGLKDIPFSPPSKIKKKSDLKVVDDIPSQTKMETLEEDMNNLKQQDKTSSQSVDGSQLPEKPSDDGVKETDLFKNNARRIFIRSRL